MVKFLFFSILTFPISLFAYAQLCSGVLELSSFTNTLLNDPHLAAGLVDMESENVNRNLELALSELTKLNHLEKENIRRNLTADFKPDPEQFTAKEFLLLGLYDKSAWLKLFDIEFNGDNFFNVPIWWQRGFLFSRMPGDLYKEINNQIELQIKKPISQEQAKKISRLLTFINNFMYRPEIEFQKELEKQSNLNQLLNGLFKKMSLQISHYKKSTPINSQQFGVLAYKLNLLLNRPEFKMNHPLVYWIGSVPNGRGKTESDFDFATDAMISDEQTQLFSDFIKENKTIDVHSISFSLTKLLYLSPLSLAFREGKMFLVVRELIPPDELFINYNDKISNYQYSKVKLWHYPVEVTAKGEWSYDFTVPTWIEEN